MAPSYHHRHSHHVAAPRTADEFRTDLYVAADVTSFRFNPYDTVHGIVPLRFGDSASSTGSLTPPASGQHLRLPTPPPAAEECAAASGVAVPAATLHRELEGAVGFVPYPTEAFLAEPPRAAKDHMVRVFLGQLPYGVTDMQLSWLCTVFGGAGVHYPERIVKKSERGRVPTGCVHAYCEPEHAGALMEGMHKRLLVDDTGVWYARDASEKRLLNAYCGALKQDPRRRVANRPYDTVVAQYAVSTYVPPPAYDAALQ